MGLMDGFRWLVGRDEPVQTRAEGSLEDLVSRIQPLRLNPWRSASNREAMGVPAVFKAVSLIANTVGSLSLEAYRSQVLLAAEDTPRICLRPNPFTRPHVFWRDSAFHLARRGEAWWWTAKRDVDGSAMSLVPIDPREITVEQDTRNLLRPKISWQNTVMPNEDMTQITYLPDPSNPLRGWGPLQACGAAVSVAVEAQEWAADWFAGNPTNTWIRSAVDIDEGEAETIKSQWMADSLNLPKVTGPLIEDVKDIGVDPERAQLSDARLFQNGEIALMFSMPPTLLNYAVQGSTITYQNVGQVADDFLRQCLLPHYLEPMEQAMSDLLTRQTIGRFNVEGLLRADIKTRYDTYNVGIPLGVISVEEARAAEGRAPGDVENRPVPFAPPQAVPASLPIQARTMELRCSACDKLIFPEVTPPFRGQCPRCKALVVADADVTEARANPPPAPPVTVNVVNNVPEFPAVTMPRQPDVIVDMGPVAAALDRLAEQLAYREAPPPITVNVPAPVVQQAEAPFTVVEGPDMTRLAEAVRPRRRRVVRDNEGRITELVEVPDGSYAAS